MTRRTSKWHCKTTVLRNQRLLGLCFPFHRWTGLLHWGVSLPRVAINNFGIDPISLNLLHGKVFSTVLKRGRHIESEATAPGKNYFGRWGATVISREFCLCYAGNPTHVQKPTQIRFAFCMNATICLWVFIWKYYNFKQDFGRNIKVQLYAPPAGSIDGNLAVLWILAVGTVTVGAYWCGITTKERM